jgi:hypothetical protein
MQRDRITLALMICKLSQYKGRINSSSFILSWNGIRISSSISTNRSAKCPFKVYFPNFGVNYGWQTQQGILKWILATGYHL